MVTENIETNYALYRNDLAPNSESTHYQITPTKFREGRYVSDLKSEVRASVVGIEKAMENDSFLNDLAYNQADEMVGGRTYKLTQTRQGAISRSTMEEALIPQTLTTPLEDL